MKRTVVGAIAVVTVAAVATMTGFGLASAASALPAPYSAAASGGNTSANAQFIQNQAGVVQVLHDQLKAAALNGDVAGTQQAVNQITTELGKLATPQGREAMSAAASSTLDKATSLNNDVAQALKQIEAGKTPVSTQSSTPQDILPPLPGPLGAIGDLLNSLLTTLLSLVTGLLGSLPVPVPLPVPTGLPVPSVPAVPSLPVSPPKA